MADNRNPTPSRRWARTMAGVGAAVAGCAVTGSIATAPDTAWYRGLRKPPWQPPRIAFPLVWTSLYAAITVAATGAITELEDQERTSDAAAFRKALALNLVLNSGWSVMFFRLHHLRVATAWSALLATSSIDLARRAAATGPQKAVVFGAYAGWTVFATALSGALAKLNPR